MTTEQHLEQLERQVRRANRTGIAALAVVMAGLILLAGMLATSRARAATEPEPEAVTASEFRLVDVEGKTRALLCLEDNNPRLRFYDEQGTVRATFKLDTYGPGLVFAQENGKLAMGLGSTDNIVSLGLGHDGNLRAVFSVDEAGKPGIIFRDSTGRTFWSAP